MATETKTCTGCHQDLPLNRFSKRKKDGKVLQSQCNKCNYESLKERRKLWKVGKPFGHDTLKLQPLLCRSF